MGYVKWHSINVFLESRNSFLLFWAQLGPAEPNWKLKFVKEKKSEGKAHS